MARSRSGRSPLRKGPRGTVDPARLHLRRTPARTHGSRSPRSHLLQHRLDRTFCPPVEQDQAFTFVVVRFGIPTNGAAVRLPREQGNGQRNYGTRAWSRSHVRTVGTILLT